MYRQHHFIELRFIGEGLILITQPQELALAVTLTNINAQVHEGRIHSVIERIRSSIVGRTLDGDGLLVVLATGRTPRTVFLLNAHRDTTVSADTVATRLSRGADKTATDTLCGELTHYAVRRDTVNRMGSLPGMVRGELGVDHQRTVAHFGFHLLIVLGQMPWIDMMDNEKVLEKHIVGENGIGYTLGEDGLYYPDLKLPEGTHYEIGKYGLMRWGYLKNHRRGEYIKLLMDGKLNEYFHEVDKERSF